MTRSFKVLGLFFICLIFSATSHATDTFVEQCLGKTPILRDRIECRLSLDAEGSELRFILVKGEKLYVKGTGKFDRLEKELDVDHIRHFGPRLTEAGPMGESIRFMAHNGSYVATVAIPCQQDAYANVGFAKTPQGEDPPERVAECLSIMPN